MVQRRRRRLRRLIPVGASAAVLLWLLLGAVLPNRSHPTVSADFAAAAQTAVYTADTVCGEEVYYVRDNTEAMELRLAMLEAAEKSVILTTFDFNSDTAGRELIAALLHAAERGVEVRILVDGISGALDLSANGWFQTLANCENVQIKIYNPLNPFLPWKMMYRLHEKYLIVDDTMYLLGGRNNTDSFLGDDSENTKIDSDVFVRRREPAAGDSTDQLLTYFEEVWNLEESRDWLGADARRGERRAVRLAEIYQILPESYPDAFETDYLDGLEMLPANKVTLLSNPVEAENKAPELWTALTAVMEEAEDVFVVTPYVMLSSQMADDLETVCAHTDHFTLMLNDVTNGANPWGCADYLNERDQVLATGVTAAEFAGGDSLHTKNVLADDRLTLVGSFNFDMRSAYLDTELMLVIDSAELNAQLREKAEEDLAYCRLATAEDETQGERFTDQQLTGARALTYGVLRQLIRPIRCLL